MMYMVMAIKHEITVGSFGGGDLAVDCNWAEGMIGAVPVFDRREDAEFYAEGRQQVVEVKFQGDKVCK